MTSRGFAHRRNPLHGPPTSRSSPYVNSGGIAGTPGIPLCTSGTTLLVSAPVRALLRGRSTRVSRSEATYAATFSLTLRPREAWWQDDDERPGIGSGARMDGRPVVAGGGHRFVSFPGEAVGCRGPATVTSAGGGEWEAWPLDGAPEKLRRERMRREPTLRSLGPAPETSREADLRSFLLPDRGAGSWSSSSSSVAAARLVPREPALPGVMGMGDRV